MRRRRTRRSRRRRTSCACRSASSPRTTSSRISSTRSRARPRTPEASVRLGAVVFLAGAATLSTEIAASRLLAPFFGSSTIVWANVIGLTLVYLSVGYWFGGRLADRRPSGALLGRIVLVAALALAVVPFVSRPFLDATVRELDTVSVGAVVGSFLGALALFAVPVTLLGTVSPFAIRLALPTVERAGTVARRDQARFGNAVRGRVAVPVRRRPGVGRRLTPAPAERGRDRQLGLVSEQRPHRRRVGHVPRRAAAPRTAAARRARARQRRRNDGAGARRALPRRRDRRCRAGRDGDGSRAPLPGPRLDSGTSCRYGGRASLSAQHRRALRPDRDRRVPPAVHPVPGDDTRVLLPRTRTSHARRRGGAERLARAGRPAALALARGDGSLRVRTGVDVGRAPLQLLALRTRSAGDARRARASRRPRAPATRSARATLSRACRRGRLPRPGTDGRPRAGRMALRPRNPHVHRARRTVRRALPADCALGGLVQSERDRADRPAFQRRGTRHRRVRRRDAGRPGAVRLRTGNDVRAAEAGRRPERDPASAALSHPPRPCRRGGTRRRRVPAHPGPRLRDRRAARHRSKPAGRVGAAALRRHARRPL